MAIVFDAHSDILNDIHPRRIQDEKMSFQMRVVSYQKSEFLPLGQGLIFLEEVRIVQK